MNKKQPQSSSHANAPNKTNPSSINILIAKYGLAGTIMTGILGLVGVTLTAYIGYLGITMQVEAPIRGTETAQAILTAMAPSFATTLSASATPPPTFDFESGTIPGWEVRWEGQNLLGVEAWGDDGHSRSGKGALAFRFDLKASPYDKAQVKYEATKINLTQELSAWINVADTAPTDLQASCFVLEHFPGGSGTKPEWPWYETGAKPLTPGRWTQVQCFASEFKPNAPYGTWTQPLMVGFSFRLGHGGGYSGTVYLDDVILR